MIMTGPKFKNSNEGCWGHVRHGKAIKNIFNQNWLAAKNIYLKIPVNYIPKNI